MTNLTDFIELHNQNIIPLDSFRNFSITDGKNIVLPIDKFPDRGYKLFCFNYGFVSITLDNPKEINSAVRRKAWNERLISGNIIKAESENDFTTHNITANIDYVPISESGLLHLIPRPSCEKLDDVLRENPIDPKGPVYYARFFDNNKKLYIIKTEK